VLLRSNPRWHRPLTPIFWLSMRFHLLLCILLLSLSSFARENDRVQGRPSIALALEGGSALGLAHIGVLQWLEEHHIPVDYVVGTSMGGLIGGAYATGMRPKEVRELIESIDWNAVLRASTEYSDLSFRRKEDRRDYPNSLEFGLRKGARFPSGFNSGQEVDFILDRIALPYSTLKSFDDLPIPFRCIATDLVGRRKYVFQSGSLSRALRSTMSIPGFFTPVRDGQRIYVDGGLLDNLPTDVARDTGADIVIGVHLQEASISPDIALSSFATLAQSFSVITSVNEQRGIELADVLVTVDVTKFAGTEYNRAGPFIDEGYKGAQKSAAELLRFALNDSDWKAYLDRREARRIKTVPAPAFVSVSGTTVEQAGLIKKDLETQQGKQIDHTQLEQDLQLLIGRGRFASMDYSISEANRRFGLHIKAVEKEYAPPTVNPIFIIDGSQYNNVLFSAGARFTLLDVGRPGAELRTDVLAGSTYQLSSEYWRPLSSTDWFIAPRGNVSSEPLNLYQRNTQIAGYRLTDLNSGLDLGYSFDRFSELRMGYETGWESYEPIVGNPNALPTASGRQGISSIRYVSDRLDNPIVPRRGTRVTGAFDFFDARPNASDKFPLLEASLLYFRPLQQRDSVYFTALAGTTFAFAKTGVPPFTLGGPFRLSAYGTNEIFTNQYMLFQLGYLRKMGELPPILGRSVYLSGAYELAKPYKTSLTLFNGFSSVPMDGTAGIVAETLFGPVYFGGSWGDSGHRKIFFKLGRIF
jgi:NTE family protein